MKQKLLLGILFAFSSTTSFSQLTKRTWLVGGNALFAFQNENIPGFDVKAVNIKIFPSIGYFFMDQLAAGVRPGLSYSHLSYNGTISHASQLTIGPFARYYFFRMENVVNMFAEASYQFIQNYTSGGNDDHQHLFMVSAGPAIFFNSSVAGEITLNFLHLASPSTTANSIYLGIGFQIHLEKEKH